MAYRRTTDGAVEDLPQHMQRAFEADRTWTQRAMCHGHELSRAHAWTISAGQVVTIGDSQIPGGQVIAAALLVCAACPAQYDCARWAVTVEAENLSGTWSALLTDMRWLISRPAALDVIASAEDEGISVQVAIRKARATRV
jgi:hypothetical protein